jgi:nitrate/nitrite transport system ATP-binding protein
MPLAMTLGAGGKTPISIVTAMTLSRNGSAITFSKELFDHGVKNLTEFHKTINADLDKTHTLGIVHPASMQNLLLRYWLATNGIEPDIDVSLITIAPEEMITALQDQKIDGYCVGEPWNTQAVEQNLGSIIEITSAIWHGHPDKVLGVREDWTQENPQTHLALVKALLAACEYCDDIRNQKEVITLTSPYLNTKLHTNLIENSSENNHQKNQTSHQFYFNKANYPDRNEMLWILTQLARWGLVAFPKNWIEIIDKVCRPDIFGVAARERGILDIGREETIQLFDGKMFNPSEPIEYLKSLEIKRQLRVEEVFI